MVCFLIFSCDVYALFTDDPLEQTKQTYLEKINVYNAWELSSGSENVVVAVIDSGVDINHIDLKDNIWTNPHPGLNSEYPDDIHGWNFVDNNNNVIPNIDTGCLSEKKCTMEGINHGTVVAGIIAATANNGEGIAGIANSVKIMPLKVLNSNGGGNVNDVIRAINYAVDNGASVINMSFVGITNNTALEATIKNAVASGVVFVVASGNNAKDGGINLDENPLYPICFDNDEDNFIIGVSALNNDNSRAFFANYGDSCIDVSAPGIDIFSTTVYKPQHSSFTSYYNGYWTGTSVAAPMVSATAAIIKSINKNFTPKQVRNIIVNSGDEVNAVGVGKKLNVYNAVKMAIEKTENDTTFTIITGAGVGDVPVVKILRENIYEESSFLAYDNKFRGGVNVAIGDVFGTGKKYIITAPASYGGPHIRIFDRDGNVKNQFFVYDKNYEKGVNVAVVNNYEPFSGANIVVSQVVGGNVKIYNGKGEEKKSFYPYGYNFTGGINITSCNLDNSENRYIVTAPASNHDSTVKIFDKNGNFVREFLVFAGSYKNGMTIGCVDYDLDGQEEIATSVIYDGKPYIRIIDKYGNFKKQFVVNDQKSEKGININGFYSAEYPEYRMIISQKTVGNSKIRIFDLNGGVSDEFYAYNKNFLGGVNFTIDK